MSRLPVIVGFGGINPAGRSSGHNAYRRMVIDKLGSSQAEKTFQSLAPLMQIEGDLTDDIKQQILNHTLVRKIENNLFDPSAIRINKSAKLGATSQPISFDLRRNQLPAVVPPAWKVVDIDGGMVKVTAEADFDVLLPDTRI